LDEFGPILKRKISTYATYNEREITMSDSPQLSNQEPEAAPSRKGIGGPKTPEGRRRSSLNAIKTMITSKIHLCSPEEQPAYDAHMAA
jgi:hypothetical protein